MKAAAMPILTYHSLDTTGAVVSTAPASFAEQMACLHAAGFTGVSLADAVAHRRANGGWPARSFVLTFDDGYASVHEVALPLLQRHGFRATLFVATQLIGQAHVAPSWAAPHDGAFLSWPQVRDLADAGVEIGSHTRRHVDLRSLSPPALESEIVGSRGELEQRLGIEVRSFAYPYGYTSPAAHRLVERTYGAACTTLLKRATEEALCVLPRIDVYYLRRTHRLLRLLRGDLDSYLAIRRWSRRLRGH